MAVHGSNPQIVFPRRAHRYLNVTLCQRQWRTQTYESMWILSHLLLVGFIIETPWRHNARPAQTVLIHKIAAYHPVVRY